MWLTKTISYYSGGQADDYDEYHDDDHGDHYHIDHDDDYDEFNATENDNLHKP